MLPVSVESLAGQHIPGSTTVVMSVTHKRLVWVMVCCPRWRTFALKSRGPRHPGAGMVTQRISLATEEQNESHSHFSTIRNKPEIV